MKNHHLHQGATVIFWRQMGSVTMTGEREVSALRVVTAKKEMYNWYALKAMIRYILLLRHCYAIIRNSKFKEGLCLWKFVFFAIFLL